jgi:tellurite resistance protein TehA-like permease
MNQQILDALLARLDALGAKLGQAGTAIWQMYVRQSKINGLELIFGAVICLLCALFFFLNTNKWTSNCLDENDELPAKITLYGVSAFFLVIFCMCLINAADYLFNPGYWAFQDLIQTVK